MNASQWTLLSSWYSLKLPEAVGTEDETVAGWLAVSRRVRGRVDVVTEPVQPSRQLQHARVAGVRWEVETGPPHPSAVISRLCC